MLILKSPDLYMFIIFGLVIYPIYAGLSGVNADENNPCLPMLISPYSVSSGLEDVKRVLREIPSGQKVFIAYRNPDGDYLKVFSGYRLWNEPIQFVCCQLGVCCLPDWHMVSEINTGELDESCWVSGPSEVKYTWNSRVLIMF